MNAGDPIRFGFKPCSLCHTWVLDVEPQENDSGDPVLDEMGAPVLVCKNTAYCVAERDSHPPKNDTESLNRWFRQTYGQNKEER